MHTTPSCSALCGHCAAIGWTLLRVGIGVTFIIHGVPKLIAGPETWTRLGGAMAFLGITTAPTLWGFLAAITEALGGLLLVAGLGTRLAAALLCGVMVVATAMHIGSGHGFAKVSHPLELGIVFLALVLCGGGPWSLDALCRRWCPLRRAGVAPADGS